MPALWTAKLVGQMHMRRISQRQLAERLGITPAYVSMVLHGHRAPPGAEDRFRRALAELISQQDHDTTKQVH